MFQYPQTSFHFVVAFELFPPTSLDSRFQEVSGLKATVNTEAVAGGNVNALPELPTKIQYEDLVLKRGVFIGSGIRMWCIKAIDEFEFEPTNLTIMLLNQFHMPMMSWYVVGAYPIEWEVSAFNAEKSELAIESIKLKYRYFKLLSLESAISAIL